MQATAHSDTEVRPVSHSVNSQGSSPLQTSQIANNADIEPIENLAPPAAEHAAETLVPSVEDSTYQEAGESVESQVAVIEDSVDVESSDQIPAPQIVAIDEVRLRSSQL